MFRNSEDKLPVAIIVAASALDFAAYFYLESTWVLAIYWLVFALPKGLICAWNHHHQHVHVFRTALLNRFYEMLLAFHTGITSNLWVLHHNLGHHVNFLDQTKDESGWARKDGTTMGELEYTFNVTATAYYRAYIVGKRYPKHSRVYLLWTTITFAVLAALFWHKPIAALFVFALPMIVSLTFTVWATYDHHAGLDTSNQFAASYNIMSRPFNIMTGNLGFHTAHHYRQAVHWSKLPELHAQIASEIPRANYLNPYFFPSKGYLPKLDPVRDNSPPTEMIVDRDESAA